MAERPWKATPEQEELEGDWADFAAWQGWIDNYLHDALTDPCEMMEEFERLDTCLKVQLYAACATWLMEHPYTPDRRRRAPRPVCKRGSAGVF